MREERERRSLVRKSTIRILGIFSREGMKEKEVEEKVVRRERGKKWERNRQEKAREIER